MGVTVPEGKKPSKWRRMPKASFSSKDLARRMRKVEGATVKHARRFVFKRWSNFKEARRHIALWVLAIGFLIGASGLQVWWYQQSYRVLANANDGTYAEAVLGPVETLNPIFASSSAEESASALLFSRLLTYDTTGNLNYDLATSMEVSRDKKTYSISMRPDAQWTDGNYIKADDVAFTVGLLQDSSTRSTLTGWDGISVQAVDERTVTFTLPDVYAAFPHALAYLPILPEHLLRDVEPSALRENKFSNSPVGSGPFTLRFSQEIDESSERKILHLIRNDDYYRGAAKLERLQLHVYADSEAIVRALNTSEVNAATDLSVADTEDLNNDRYTVDHRPVNSGVYALFNTTTGVMEDARVRKALQAGTDTEALRAVVGKDTPALHLPFINGQISAKMPGAPEYDPKRAATLLDQAGWKINGGVRKKGKTELKLDVVTTNNRDFKKVLETLEKQWRSLGITVTTTIVDPTDPSQNVVQKILQPRRYDVLLYQLTIGGDPDVYAYWHSSQASGGFNFTNYENAVADEALSSARTVTQDGLRAAKYVTFAQQWLRDAPAVGLYQTTAQYVYGSTVNARPAQSSLVGSTERYADVLYWTVGERIVHRTP